MKKVNVDVSNALPLLKQNPYDLQEEVNRIHKMIFDKTGKGNDYLGWLDLPYGYDKEEYQRIKQAANKIRKDSDVLVVIGIGGSYLGAKAALEFLKVPFSDSKPEIIFAGHQMSGSYLNKLIEYLEDKNYSINVISKSGTTTEPAIAFRILKAKIEEKYGLEEACKRIFATTDKKAGALYSLATKAGYEKFVVPDDVGGRFSVLTAVGLLPLACAGVNIDELLSGAQKAYDDSLNPNLNDNSAYLYAATRFQAYNSGKEVEIFAAYEPCVKYIGEWWKQLYGESEGKEHKGLFVSSVNFSTDLHSMGQYIQDGLRILLETVIKIEETNLDVTIPLSEDDSDELNYLAGKSLSYVNEQALKGTLMAHVDGLVPNIIISVPQVSEFHLGYLFFFFEIACAMSAYLLDVNPFNQPGVEAYKRNMFALLGKKGYKK